MAHTANTSWEVRSTASVATGPGGAGFDPSFGGTDYSQRDTPILTHTDGVISSTNLQSTLGGFTSQMVGNSVYLSVSQTWKQITAFVDANNVTLESAPGNSSGNTYNVGGAYLVGQNGFQFPYQPGNIIWWRGSINPTVNQPNIGSTDGTKYVTLRGYGTVRGDSGFGTIIGGSISADTFGMGDRAIVENMIFDGNNSQARNGCGMGGSYSRMQNCIIRNNTSTAGGVNILGNYNEVKNCYIDVHGTTGAGINVGSVPNPAAGCVIEHNVIKMNTSNHGIVWDAGSFGVAQFNVIFGANCGIAFFNGGSNWNQGAVCNFNTIANCTQKGIIVLNINTGMEHIDIKGNIFSNCAVAAIWWDGTDLTTIAPGTTEYLKCNLDTNAFWINGANYHGLPASPSDIALTNDPFVDDITTFNFQLNNVAGGGAACRNAWVVTSPDGVTIGTYSIGALGAATAAVVPPAALAGVAPTIDEVQFPVQISEGATGGAAFSTIVVVAGNGQEQRTPLYTHGRYKWNAGPGMKSPSDMAVVTAFWLARQGKGRGFRWKDWDDFQATAQALTIDGSPSAQLVKTYTSGGITYTRIIYKPQQNNVAVSIQRNGSGYASWTLNTTTGIVTWTPIIQKAVSGITAASSAVVTVPTGHGFVLGDVVYFNNVAGMTQINGLTGAVTATTSATITVAINSSTFTAYSSSGTVSKYPQPSDTITWTGEFDVPVRFDTDEQMMVQEAATYRSWSNLPVIELTGG